MVFRHNQLHLDFERIFGEIDDPGVYKNDNITDINIKYKGVVYKIWSIPVDKGAHIFRISTFFPISSSKILDKLQENYDEVSITNELSVFVKKK